MTRVLPALDPDLLTSRVILLFWVDREAEREVPRLAHVHIYALIPTLGSWRW